MADLNQFFVLLDSLLALFDEMIELENNKLDAIAVNDIKKLEEYMKQEQAYAMKMRGMDGKRDAVQADLGFENMTLKEIVSNLDGEQARRLEKIDTALRYKVDELKDAVDCSKKYIELHINSIQTLLDKTNEKKNNPGTYDSAGGKQDKNPPERFTPKKI